MKKSVGAKTLALPAPVYVVGSYDKAGKPNAMVASWAGICCSVPPCVAVSLRKVTASYGNLIANRAFTLSVPSEAHLKEVDFMGCVSGTEVDKFAATGLTPVRSTVVYAPYVEQFPVALECELIQTLELGIHVMFVGRILDVKVEESMLGANSLIDIKRVRPLVFEPDTQSYFGIGELRGRAFVSRKDPARPAGR
jgi:flavin reductase (DIM6/NTAB) family NADH-FMN oxidoreductase RutF